MVVNTTDTLQCDRRPSRAIGSIGGAIFGGKQFTLGGLVQCHRLPEHNAPDAPDLGGDLLP